MDLCFVYSGFNLDNPHIVTVVAITLQGSSESLSGVEVSRVG
jgi:hypothetical protein